MTINFPKFPHDRRDKALSPNPNLPDITFESVTTETAEITETQAHNRSHQEMLKHTEYLDDVQVAELKAQLTATPKKAPKSLPIVPLLIGLLLLAGGGAMGYMYQEYNRPAPASAPVSTTPTANATPVAPTTPPASAVAVTTTTVATNTVANSSGAVTPPPAPITTSTSIMNANTPRANPPAVATAENKITVVPISAPMQTAPPSNNSANPANNPATNQPNSPPNSSANNPAVVDITNNSLPPVNTSNPAQAQPTQPNSDAPINNASQSLKKSQASYDEFVKKSESTIYVDHAPIKK